MGKSGKTAMLLVESDPGLRTAMAAAFTQEGHAISIAATARAAREALLSKQFDMIVVNAVLKGESGLGLCRHIRHRKTCPIIVICPTDGALDRVVALEMGADDVVELPLNVRELTMRARNVARRAERATAPLARAPTSVRFSGWRLSAQNPVLTHNDGRAVRLSQNEHAMLLAMAARPRMPFTREDLLRVMQGDAARVAPRSVDNQIVRLRRKLGEGAQILIRTVKDAGYALSATVIADAGADPAKDMRRTPAN